MPDPSRGTPDERHSATRHTQRLEWERQLMEQTGLTRSQVRQGLKAGLQQVQTVVDAQRVVQGGAPPPPPPKLEFGETKLETSKGQINTAPAANTQQQAPGGTTNLVLVACRGNLNGSYATKHLYGPAT